MLRKFIKKPLAWLILFLVLLASGYFILHKNYTLNKTVREIAMRLVQVESLSKNTGVEYKVRFYKDRYRVDVHNRNTGEWENYTEDELPKEISCDPIGFEYFFVRGRFRQYTSVEGKTKAPRSIIIQFLHKKSGKKKSIIFYRDGDWKVLG